MKYRKNAAWDGLTSGYHASRSTTQERTSGLADLLAKNLAGDRHRRAPIDDAVTIDSQQPVSSSLEAHDPARSRST